MEDLFVRVFLGSPKIWLTRGDVSNKWQLAHQWFRIKELLGLWNKLTRAMFCSVVAGKKNLMFFPARKAVDERWEVVALLRG